MELNSGLFERCLDEWDHPRCSGTPPWQRRGVVPYSHRGGRFRRPMDRLLA